MIRKANLDDLAQVAAIYEELFDVEERQGSYTNWMRGIYPTEDYAAEAIRNSTMFVGVEAVPTSEQAEGRPVAAGEGCHIYGSVILNEEQPEEYSQIPWNARQDDRPVLVVHTLCIRPSDWRCGRATELLRFCRQYGEEHGYGTIRLDTHERNAPATALYLREGFQLMGRVEFHFKDICVEPLKCLELLL